MINSFLGGWLYVLGEVLDLVASGGSGIAINVAVPLSD